MGNIKLEFELEDLKGFKLLIEDEDKDIVEVEVVEIRKSNYVKFRYNNGEARWMRREDVLVVDILN